MERPPYSTVQNFDDPKTDILKKRLLKSGNTAIVGSLSHNNTQQNALMNTLRPPLSSSMLVSSVQAPQSSVPLTNLVTHSITPMKIHPNNTSYPLQLSTVQVPVQIPGPTSNINVLSAPPNNVPLQITAPTVSVPIQVSGATTNVPVQLPTGDTLNVSLQLPAANQNIQLATSGLPSMPILQNSNQSLHNSIFHVHMASNSRGINTNLDGTCDMNMSAPPQLQLPDSNNTLQVKMANNTTNGGTVQVNTNPTMMQIPNSANNSMHVQIPNSCAPGTVQLRGTARPMPHVVYIQTPTGLKPVTSTEVISQASTTGNHPQIIVRRPVTSTPNIQLISNVNKTHIPSKVMSGQNKASILAPANSSQPIVIQKPKPSDKMIVPVTIASNSAKQAITYLGTVKKSNKLNENQSILLPNNQINSNINSTGNQKLFITPMNMPKMQNTKYILPVTLPGTMASKGPIINLQIANGQLQNDPQGNITIMRDTGSAETTEMPPLQPLGKVITSVNSKESTTITTSVPQSPKTEKAFALSIHGSRAESTGEQEYSLSIPETNASMNDDVYTVSIANEEGGQTREKSFTLAIPEKGKSLLTKNLIDRSDNNHVTIPAPAILRRSNSDNSERKAINANIKRRISLCTENISNKTAKIIMAQARAFEKQKEEHDSDNNDDHRVPSLFCDEKLDKDLEAKGSLDDSDPDNEGTTLEYSENNANHQGYYKHNDDMKKDTNVMQKRESVDSALEEDPPGLVWNNGVAFLQGSVLKFQTNEFGLIDLIENNDHVETFLLNPTTKYSTPIKQRIDRSGREKKPTSPEDLYRCDGCGCHGMAAEFITPNFCSLTCQSDVQKSAQKKKDRERAELMKKKNRMKKLFMRKHIFDSDLQGEKEPVGPKHYDSAPTERLSESMFKMSEETLENDKYPWMCGKSGFSWIRYLEFCKAKAAPVKLFKDPFPYNKSGFKVGMRMEAIDPAHPSLFCVVSVAEVQGYRMRLHFDDYPDVYDFWVNADSIDIFPPGWCEKNGRKLKPPSSCGAAGFSWPLYLKQVRAVAAPKHLFSHLCNTMVKPNGFRIGMKLEADDRKNSLVCVATVADMLDNRILINFDSWDEMYDYWVDPTSPYIHPVGWAEDNEISLTPPNFYKDPDSFSWEAYLAESSAAAAPARAFKTRAPQGFRVGMKLEVVDKRVPFLIRVASIAEVKGHQVRVSFDGWPEDFSHWLDDDSPDIHPVGWCLKTGHPLEPPLSAEELSGAGPCGVGGCRGLGSLRGGAHKAHAAASACPYRRPAPAPPPPRHAPAAGPAPAGHAPIPAAAAADDHALPRSKKLPRGRPPKHRRIEEATKEEVSDEESAGGGGKRWRAAAGAAAGEGARAGAAARLRTVLEHLALPPEPRDWTESEVVALVTRVAGAEAGAAAAGGRLAGAELLMASREELVDCLRLRLGPAIKVYDAIKRLRETCT